MRQLGWVLLLLLGTTACVPGKYRVKMIPEAKMNEGSEAAVRVDLVWTTPTTLNELRNLSAKEWFSGKFQEYESRSLVIGDEVLPTQGGARYFVNDANTSNPDVLRPPTMPSNAESITGYVVFASYGEGLKSTVVVGEPKLYFWVWGAHEQELIFSEKGIFTPEEIKDARVRAIAEATAESATP